MKFYKELIILIIISLALFACTDNIPAESEEGMDFSEEEVMDQPDEEGMDFSEEEGMDLSGPEPGDLPDDEAADEDAEMVFDEDEVEPVPDPPNVILPPEGNTNWQITHDEGTVNCPEGNISITIDPSPPETVSIFVGVNADSLTVTGFGDTPEILFFLLETGPGGSRYKGYYTPPGFTEEIVYELVFTNLTDPTTADFVFGTISADEQGCDVSRSFSGNRNN